MIKETDQQPMIKTINPLDNVEHILEEIQDKEEETKDMNLVLAYIHGKTGMRPKDPPTKEDRDPTTLDRRI